MRFSEFHESGLLALTIIGAAATAIALVPLAHGQVLAWVCLTIIVGVPAYFLLRRRRVPVDDAPPDQLLVGAECPEQATGGTPGSE